jgi:hypothetical protein
MRTLQAYIYFPENLDGGLDTEDPQFGRTIIKDFHMTIDLADCEKHSSLFYSKSNKDIFFDNIRAFEELSKLNIGVYDLETTVNTIFNENDAYAVNESKDDDCTVVNYNAKIGDLDKSIPSIFNDIIKRNTGEDGDKQIILNLFNHYFSQNPILVIQNCKNDIVKTIQIPFVTKFSELDKWLVDNRLKRNYNMDDNRHIENHPQSQINSHNKSPLIGGISGKPNAANLLENAIGDKRDSKDLMNFDSVNNCYIWYEFENINPQNQYHGYHLVKVNDYVEDEKAVLKIPVRVKNILDYRKTI